MSQQKNNVHRRARKALIVGALVVATGGVAQSAHADTPEDLNRQSDSALQMLEQTNPTAANIASKAKAILIFPTIVKAGLIFGGAYGEGELKSGPAVDGYYNSITASWGLQAGAQSYGYAVFLMNDRAVRYVHQTHGWELGTDPSIVVVNVGAAKNLSTSTLKDDAYAFVFDQKGLMGSLSLEGTKVSRIHEP